MPKIVDPAARRAEIVDAVLRIVERDGLENATLRAIAAESGLAIGSVRHYFTDHAEVMSVAMEELVDRLSARILARVDAINEPGADRQAGVEALLEEFLPLDDQRRLEAAAWLSFINAARTEPRLRGYARTMHEGTREIIGRVIARIGESGAVAEPFDTAAETDRLAALIDGLTLQGVHHPDLPGPAAMRRAIRHHLDSLLTKPGRA